MRSRHFIGVCLTIVLLFILPQTALSLTESQIISNAITRVTTDDVTTYQTSEGTFISKDTTYPKYEGYIIEFKDKPVVEYEKEMEESIEQREKSLAASHPLYRYTLGLIESAFISYDKSALPSRVSDQRNKIQNLHERIKEDIRKKRTETSPLTGHVIEIISSKVEEAVLGEYKDVFSGIALNISEEEILSLKKLDYVKDIYPNYEVNITLMDSVPLINADDVWNLQDSQGRNITGQGTTIAIIDTGIDYTHPDLGGCFGPTCKVIGGYDFVNNDDNPMDDHGHGTHCAGIAAGNGALKGVAPDAKLYAYKVLNSGGSGTLSQVIAGIERAVDPNNDGNFSDHADVISMSLGGYGNPDDPVSKAVDNAVDAGVVVVVAAGNSGPSKETIGSPGTARKAITVGATYKKDYNETYWGDTNPREDQITSFSSRGPVVWENGTIIKPDVVAPGAMICASRYDEIFPEGQHSYYKPCLDEHHVQLAGTSMACPHVAGASALMKQAHRDWTPEEIKLALRNTALDLGYDINTQGYGRIDILEAIRSGKPPIARIDTSGKIAGTAVDVIGTAKAENFINYVLYYGESNNLSNIQWLEICSSTSQIINNVLCVWNITSLNDGLYSLKLVVNSQTQENVEFSPINLQNVEISYPQDLRRGFYWDVGEVFPSWKEIEIRGSSEGYNLDHYKIEWSKEGGSWNTQGIELSGNGYSPVVNGVLGKWNISLLSDSYRYHIRLTSYFKDGREEAEEVEIYIDTKIQEGWPRYLVRSRFSFIDQPTIADIDNDGKNDLITAYEKDISVFKYNGEQASGWPKKIETSCDYYSVMQISPAVGDLDKDGFNEIVAGDSCGYLHILNHDGTYLNGWPKRISKKYVTGVVIADIDNDNEYEIIFGSTDRKLYIVKLDGTNLIQPKIIGSFPYGNSGLAVGDIDNDGNQEIVVRTEYLISVFDYRNGTLVKNWSKTLSDSYVVWPNVVLADIDQASKDLEIITFDIDTVYIWDKNGNDVEGWPQKLDCCSPYSNKQTLYSLAVGDINGDDNLDIIIFGRYSCTYALNNKGEKLPGSWPNYNRYIGLSLGAKPLLNDIIDDENIDIPFPAYNEGVRPGDLLPLHVIKSDGSKEKITELEDGIYSSGLPMADLDADGDVELVAFTKKGNLFVWDLPGKAEKYEWPQFYHDSRHTSLYAKPGEIKCTIPSSPNCNLGACQCDVTICQNGWLRARMPDNTELVKYFTSGNIIFNTGSKTGTATGYISCRDDGKEYPVSIVVK